ncbi:Aldo-keto reductase yakc [Metarhizium brunneum]|uniref:Aldo-keto reductase yakc n=1 Tax=Metarhizium brunneum TaxID=500148 RepID=A0A7D5UX79_9HYPO|nr:Aldo-keto reductase yakc [Metarhizium brunneum]
MTDSVPTRQLGRNGPRVTGIGLGLMSFAGWYGQKDTSVESSLALLDRAHEIGERFWDTADVYTGSEQRVGEWFRRSGKRDDIFLATKFAVRAGADGSRTVDNDPAWIREACAASLARLGTDVIDLYYVHRIDDKTPIERTIQTMAELKREGKIRHLGLSECSAATIRRAHAVHPIAAYQVEYSPLFLDIESDRTGILQTCRELGIAVVAYSPVGRGLLTGAVTSLDDLPPDDWRRGVPKLGGDNFPRIMALVDRIREVARRHGATPAQVCLAWVAAQGDDVIPIPGTTTLKYLEDNTGALKIKLTADEVAELRRYAEETELPGDRYPSSMASLVFRDSVPLE